jgi:dipeptide/tripeptide permease
MSDMSSVSAETATSGAGSPARDPAMERHPTGFWFFFWGEFAERSSYYGMRAILPLYLAGPMELSAADAGSVYYSFKMACYFLPLVGGFLADRYFGRYWTIVGFSLPYVLGHFVLGIENRLAMFIALFLLAGGSGVIKPNISSLMGQTYDQKRPGNARLRVAAFNWFYFSINVGAVISSYTLPGIRDDFGYAIAFQFPAWLMVGALCVFAAGKKHYALETLEQRPKTAEEKKEQWQTLVRLFWVFGCIVFFWVGYEHNDSLWVYFARDYVELTLPFSVPFVSNPVPPDQIQSLNPLFVLITIPLFSWLFGWIDPQVKIFTATRKILAGFVLTAVAVGVMSAAGFVTQSTGQKISIMWMVAAYIIITVGEVLLYGTGLELSYSAAPKNMKGFVAACFLLTNTLGNLINTVLCRLYGGSLTDAPDKRGPLPPGEFFAMTVLIVLAATVAFYFVGRQFDQQRNSAKTASA